MLKIAQLIKKLSVFTKYESPWPLSQQPTNGLKSAKIIRYTFLSILILSAHIRLVSSGSLTNCNETQGVSAHRTLFVVLQFSWKFYNFYSCRYDRQLNDRWQGAASGLTQYDIDTRIVNTQSVIKLGFGMNSYYFLWGHESVMDKINKRNKHKYKEFLSLHRAF